MHAKKASVGDLPGSVGNEPDRRCYHDFRLDQLGAIEACLIGNHRSIGRAAGNEDADSDAGTLEILRHNRAERLERSLGGP